MKTSSFCDNLCFHCMALRHMIFVATSVVGLSFSTFFDFSDPLIQNQSHSTNNDDEIMTRQRRRIKSSGRIINGAYGDLKNHPWLVYLEMCEEGNCEQCGGSVLSKRTILTAKHCVKGKTCQGVIRYGSKNKFQGRGFRFKCSGKNVYRNEWTDIAVIKLSPRQRFDAKAVAIPKNFSETPVVGATVYAVGWGRACNTPRECPTQDWHPTNFLVVKLNITAIKKPECNFGHGDMICAGGPDEKGMKKDSCQGDSGGPLECTDHLGLTYQCGAVSTGPGNPNCGRSHGAYVNLANEKIIKWLKEVGDATSEGRIRTNVDRSSQGDIATLSHQIKSRMELICSLLCVLFWLRTVTE